MEKANTEFDAALKLVLSHFNLGNKYAVKVSTGVATLKERIAELERELTEQARCNGMGSEREAALMAKVERLESELSVATESMRVLKADYAIQAAELAAAQATIQRLERESSACDMVDSLQQDLQTFELIATVASDDMDGWRYAKHIHGAFIEPVGTKLYVRKEKP